MEDKENRRAGKVEGRREKEEHHAGSLSATAIHRSPKPLILGQRLIVS
jgi:hypothetical protein